MFGMDARTGRTLRGFEQLASRLQQLFTTRQGSRYRRRAFGCHVPDYLGRNVSPDVALLIKADMFDAMADPANGITDFSPKQIELKPADAGFFVSIFGHYEGEYVEVKVHV